MPDILREIEKGYEAKYKLDEELHFKMICRCHKMLGLWAADHLGLDGQQADEYARHLVRLTLDKPGAAAVLEKVKNDFRHAEIKLGDADVMAAYHRFYALACEQVGADYPTPLGTDHVQVGG